MFKSSIANGVLGQWLLSIYRSFLPKDSAPIIDVLHGILVKLPSLINYHRVTDYSKENIWIINWNRSLKAKQYIKEVADLLKTKRNQPAPHHQLHQQEQHHQLQANVERYNPLSSSIDERSPTSATSSIPKPLSVDLIFLLFYYFIHLSKNSYLLYSFMNATILSNRHSSLTCLFLGCHYI